ncbi:MAG: cupredoxin domain-containing protein, partial [Thermomicrobiales bacterium]
HMHGAPAPAPDPAPTAAASTVAATGDQTTESPSDLIEVAMLDDRFDPPELTVPAGTLLRFVNRGANWHSVAAFDGSFDSGRVDPEATFDVLLDTAGTYQFLCKHHGLRGMVGQVTVTS